MRIVKDLIDTSGDQIRQGIKVKIPSAPGPQDIRVKLRAAPDWESGAAGKNQRGFYRGRRRLKVRGAHYYQVLLCTTKYYLTAPFRGRAPFPRCTIPYLVLYSGRYLFNPAKG